jgi:hypothetical protein
MESILMLSLIQQAALKGPPTVTDSLKHSLAQVQHRLDSIGKVVMKTEIGTEFFSDIISANLLTYGTILTILGLVSWGWFFYRFKVIEQTLKRELVEKFSSIEAKINKIDLLEERVNVTSYNVHRTNLLATDRSDSFLFLNASIECLGALLKCDIKKYEDELNYIIEITNITSKLLKPGELSAFKNDNRLKRNIAFLSSSILSEKAKEIDDIINDIQASIYSNVSKP